MQRMHRSFFALCAVECDVQLVLDQLCFKRLGFQLCLGFFNGFADCLLAQVDLLAEYRFFLFGERLHLAHERLDAALFAKIPDSDLLQLFRTLRAFNGRERLILYFCDPVHFFLQK
jgi:hypothetical protein